MPDLHQKMSVLLELQNMPVGRRAAPDPDVSIFVHINSVLVLRPIKSLARPAPRLEQMSLLVELEHRRRRNAALRTRWPERSANFVHRKRSGPLQNPDVVLRVHSQSADLPDDPVVRQLLRPERGHSILRRLLRASKHRTSAKQDRRPNRRANQDPCTCLVERESVHEALRQNNLPLFRIGAEYRAAPGQCQRTLGYARQAGTNLPCLRQFWRNARCADHHSWLRRGPNPYFPCRSVRLPGVVQGLIGGYAGC